MSELKKGKTLNQEEDSEEDLQLQVDLNLLVKTLTEANQEKYLPALQELSQYIRASTTSLTSVPKPLKYMRVHYGTMKEVHNKIKELYVKKVCADIVSVLSMAVRTPRDCLKYRQIGSQCEVGYWGHEYVRQLSADIAGEWVDSSYMDEDLRRNLLNVVNEIIPYNMTHNAEIDACDLLLEIEHLELIDKYVDESAYMRVCLYLTSCAPYASDLENTTLLCKAIELYRRFNQYPQAMQLAMQLNNPTLIADIFTSCRDLFVKKQLAYMLVRQQIFLEVGDDEVLREIMSNAQLNNHFLSLARELDIMEPKIPEDIYKSHLDNPMPFFSIAQIDSAKQNLAASFVNGFINCAFGIDKLLTDEGNRWIYKNSEHGKMSATASLGLVLLWDVDRGLPSIDKYFYSTDDYVKAGALLGCGIINCSVRSEFDPAIALLSDYVLNKSNSIRIGAILGLGLAYAGSNNATVINQLTAPMSDPSSNMEVICMAGLACGLVSVGSCNANVTTVIMQTLMENVDKLQDIYAPFLALGLGLCYLGRQDTIEAIIAALEVIPEPYKSMAVTLVDVCAYAGSGNVLKVQKLLHICSERYEVPDKDEKNEEKKKGILQKDLSMQQGIATLGIALISMGEEIGTDMTFRTLGHLLRYGEPTIRKAVPLALGLISVSNPSLTVLDMLSKFSHDSNPAVAHNAIFAMGLVGAGTNNPRLAALLRQLAQYYMREPNSLFLVRIAQGLVHLGKGTLTLSPYHSERQIMNPVAVAGLLATLVGFLDEKNIILGRSHYLLFTLTASMQHRMLVTFDETMSSVPVPVRVGVAVAAVGQVGKPKTITGFQTHTTPILLGIGERAELATDEYLPLTPIMEGFVILRKNANYNPNVGAF